MMRWLPLLFPATAAHAQRCWRWTGKPFWHTWEVVLMAIAASIIGLALGFWIKAAHAQAPDSKYLVHPDIATCRARSHAQARALSMDGDGHPHNFRTVEEDGPPTKTHPASEYPSMTSASIAQTKADGGNWWNCTLASDGKQALMEVRPSGDFSQSATKAGTGALTNPEISSLKTSAEIAPLMPSVTGATAK